MIAYMVADFFGDSSWFDESGFPILIVLTLPIGFVATIIRLITDPRVATDQTMPKRYLVESILVTIFCFLLTILGLLLGIAGIVFASSVKSLWQSDAYAEAHEAARKARMLSLIAMGLGIVAAVVKVLLVNNIIELPEFLLALM